MSSCKCGCDESYGVVFEVRMRNMRVVVMGKKEQAMVAWRQKCPSCSIGTEARAMPVS